ncbi:unnamed protein product, partial [Rotaria magnacalcarata]
MLQKPVNDRCIERVANLIQEYRIAEMKHIDGKSNCLADYLSRPADDPLFDVDYGLESKLLCSSLSHLHTPHQPSVNIVAPMILRPRRKFTSLGVSDLDKVDDHSDASSCSSEDSFTTCSPIITTTPSPNAFDPSQLSHEQTQDSNIRSIISQLNQNEPCDFTLSSSFIMKTVFLTNLLLLLPNPNADYPYLIFLHR